MSCTHLLGAAQLGCKRGQLCTIRLARRQRLRLQLLHAHERRRLALRGAGHGKGYKGFRKTKSGFGSQLHFWSRPLLRQLLHGRKHRRLALRAAGHGNGSQKKAIRLWVTAALLVLAPAPALSACPP